MRLARALPPGTVPVGAGMAVLALAAYVQLAVAGRALSEAQMASMSALWAIVFAVAPGLFFPLEQELTRLTAARRQAREPLLPVLYKGLTLTVLILGALAVVCAVFTRPLAGGLFGGDAALVWITLAALAANAVAHMVRGVLAGMGRFGWYGAQVGLDGMLRIAGVAMVFAVPEVRAHAAVLALAPAIAVLCTSAPLLRIATPGEPLPWGQLSRRLGLLVVAFGMSQVMINIGVISARLMAPEQTALTVGLLAALILVRVPVFVYGAMQASLLSSATSAAQGGNFEQLRRLIMRGLGFVGALAAVGAIVTVAAGTTLSSWIFNAPQALARSDFLLLSIGTGVYLLALLLGQVTVALELHRAQAVGWAAGTAVLLAVTLLPLPLNWRIELAFTAGAATTALLLASALRGRLSLAKAATIGNR